MKVYESTYYTISLDGDTIINRWKDTTVKMSYQDFKDALMNLAGYIIEHKSKKILIDTTSFQFTLPSENVTFRNEEFYPRITKVGTNRQALVLHKEYLAYVKDEVAETDVVKTRYFASETEAIEWLSS
jgi:SpoIIAA-like